MPEYKPGNLGTPHLGCFLTNHSIKASDVAEYLIITLFGYLVILMKLFFDLKSSRIYFFLKTPKERKTNCILKKVYQEKRSNIAQIC